MIRHSGWSGAKRSGDPESMRGRSPPLALHGYLRPDSRVRGNDREYSGTTAPILFDDTD